MAKRKLPSGMWKRGNVYYARFKHRGHEVRKRLSTNLTAATEMLNDLKARLDKAGAGILDNSYPWDDLKREYLTWAKQQLRTAGQIEATLNKFEEYRKPQTIARITNEYLMGFRQWRLNQGVTPRTVNKQITLLGGMLTKGVQWGHLATNPVKGLKPLKHDNPVKVRRSLDAAEAEAILENCQPHMQLPILCYLTTGMRRSELVNLKFEDIDFSRGVAIIRAEHAKSGKLREVPICGELLEGIAELKRKAQDRQPVAGKTPAATEQQLANFSRDHVFVSTVNTPLKNNLLRAFRVACKRAGIKDADINGAVDLHSVRVSFVTLAIENGGSPKAVQDIVGHSTLGLTMGIYAKARDGAKRDAVNGLPFATRQKLKVVG